MITRRTSERRFFMRPSKEVNGAIEYCLARAVKRAGVTLHAAVFLSNHYHIIVTDPSANVPVFAEELNKLVARCLNCRYGRFENFWAGSTQTSYVELTAPEDVLAKCCYTLLNPVEAGLVKSWRDWPGLVVVGPGKRKAKRPDFFFRDDLDGGALPPKQEYTVHAPPIAESAGPSMGLLYDMVRELQKQIVAQRKRAGLGFLGAKRIRQQTIWDSPDFREPRFETAPRVASRDKWRRIEALRGHKGFVNEHREALAAWQDRKRDAVFPPGTYLMRVLHRVKCALAPRSAQSPVPVET